MQKRQKVAATLFLGVAVGSGAYLSTLSGQGLPKTASADPLPSPAVRFQQTVLPVLAKNCFACHSDRVHTAGLSLEALQDTSLALQKPEIWSKVLDKLKAGTMPPRNFPQPSPADVAAVTGWIQSLQSGAPAGAPTSAASAAAAVTASNADPGRVTARRLNRTEYNNTIHDLLGVTLRPADEFPADDSGYGFDNIGDVLSVSPLLMEKYVSAAARRVQGGGVRGKLSAEAHAPDAADAEENPGRCAGQRHGDAVLRAGRDVHDVPRAGGRRVRVPVPLSELPWRRAGGHDRRSGRRRSRARGQRAWGAPGAGAPSGPGPTGAPGCARCAAGPGAGAGPGRGGFVRRELTDEEKAARLEALRTAAPPEPIVFTVDGKEIYRYVVEGTTDYEYSRGESVARVTLTAGDHALRVSFPGLANMANPRAQFNPDGRRKLYVDYFDVLGPYNPSPEPPASFKKIFICGQPGSYSADCTRKIIDNLVTRAYRRPATAAEVQKLLGLVAQVRKQDSFEEGVRVALQAVLASPNFLFRIERDPAASAPPASASLRDATAGQASYQVSDYELASRLSYFLWNTMPDDQLFEAAAQKQLHDPAVLSAQVHRMLQDPKAVALAHNFGSQWLNLGLMDRTKPDAQKFLMVDDELLDAMRQETLMFVDAVVKEDRSILDFIDGKFTFVNGFAGATYGIKGVDGEQSAWRWTATSAAEVSIVTQGAILSIFSRVNAAPPVLRGKWVLDNLSLARRRRPPPDGIPPPWRPASAQRRRCGSASSSIAPTPVAPSATIQWIPFDRVRSRELRRGRRHRTKDGSSTSTTRGSCRILAKCLWEPRGLKQIPALAVRTPSRQ